MRGSLLVVGLFTLAGLALHPGPALLIVLAVAATLVQSFDGPRGELRRADAPVPATRPASGGAPPETVDLLTARRVSLRLDEAARAMSDVELCRAWRRSLRSLTEARSPIEHLAVVLQRQSFLDALEARNHEAFRRWLASGAPASTGPAQFLTGHACPTRETGEQ